MTSTYKRENPFFRLVKASGLSLTIPFQQKIVMTVNGQTIELYLMSTSSNQACIKFICDKSVDIQRVNYVDDSKPVYKKGDSNV